jgi:hypothetical protein
VNLKRFFLVLIVSFNTTKTVWAVEVNFLTSGLPLSCTSVLVKTDDSIQISEVDLLARFAIPTGTLAATIVRHAAKGYLISQSDKFLNTEIKPGGGLCGPVCASDIWAASIDLLQPEIGKKYFETYAGRADGVRFVLQGIRRAHNGFPEYGTKIDHLFVTLSEMIVSFNNISVSGSIQKTSPTYEDLKQASATILIVSAGENVSHAIVILGIDNSKMEMLYLDPNTQNLSISKFVRNNSGSIDLIELRPNDFSKGSFKIGKILEFTNIYLGEKFPSQKGSGAPDYSERLKNPIFKMFYGSFGKEEIQKKYRGKLVMLVLKSGEKIQTTIEGYADGHVDGAFIVSRKKDDTTFLYQTIPYSLVEQVDIVR